MADPRPSSALMRPPLELLRELEARPRARQSQEFDPVAAIAAENRRSASSQPLPLPPIPPAVVPPPPAGDRAGAGALPAETVAAIYPGIRDRLPENNPWVAAATRIAEKYNLPRDVFLSLVNQESRFDPAATSRRGAVGLTQLMPGTARDLGVDPRDPEANLDAGARYLRQQLNRFGSLPLALAAYNAGPQRVIDAGREVPRIKETVHYVDRILRNAGMEGYQHPGYDPEKGYAEGGPVTRELMGQPFPNDYSRYLYTERPEIDWAGGKRPLNIRNLHDLGAFRLADWEGDPNSLSLVSYFNDSAPDSITTNWPTTSRQKAEEILSAWADSPWPLYTGKYNQIVDSARRLGISENDIFLPRESSTVEGYAEGGPVRESLADLEDRYADGGAVRRPAAAPVPSPSDLNYLDTLVARAVGGAGVDELRSSEGRDFAPMPRNASEALQRMSAVIRGDVEPTPDEARQISQVRGFTEGPASIRAYHGSPHKFEKFDVAKVGTGEGAQAQGHGLYFAEYEPIAKWYRESTAGGPITTDFSVGNIPLIRRERPVDYTPTRYDPESIAKSTLQEALLILEPSLRDMPDNAARVGAVKETIQRLISDEGYPAEATRYWNRVLGGLEEGRTPLRYSVEQPGHMYEVNLRTTPERLLDWDQPLNLQPDPVREALRSRFGRDYEKLEGMTNYRPGGGGMRGEDFYESYLGGKDQAPFASQQLREVGIPGVRYLDARSRAAGEGSRNYVMFDDTLIDLLQRYGLMGAVGAGAAVAGAEEMAQ